jgi:hypothetical protein
MPEHPAEIPAEGEGGSGRIDWTRFRGGIGGPNELPPFEATRVSLLINEIFRLRDRVHALESNILATKMSASGAAISRFASIGGPNELPEGEGGGSGGGRIPFPGEIHEIAELPISRIVVELGSLVARFAQFEKTVVQQLGAITQRLDALKK